MKTHRLICALSNSGEPLVDSDPETEQTLAHAGIEPGRIMGIILLSAFSGIREDTDNLLTVFVSILNLYLEKGRKVCWLTNSLRNRRSLLRFNNREFFS